jgi:hypothetical protein
MALLDISPLTLSFGTDSNFMINWRLPQRVNITLPRVPDTSVHTPQPNWDVMGPLPNTTKVLSCERLCSVLDPPLNPNVWGTFRTSCPWFPPKVLQSCLKFFFLAGSRSWSIMCHVMTQSAGENRHVCAGDEQTDSGSRFPSVW